MYRVNQMAVMRLGGGKRRSSFRHFVGAAAMLGLAGVFVLTSCAQPATPPATTATTTPRTTAAPTSAPVPAATVASPAAPTAVPAAVPTTGAVKATKGTITFGVMGDYSGPTAASATDMVLGLRDFLRYLNENKGGVKGYSLDVVDIDTKLDANLTRSAWVRLNDTLAPPASGRLVYATMANAFAFVRESARKDKIVLLNPSGAPSDIFLTKSDVASADKNFSFTTIPTTIDRALVMTAFAVDEWKKQGKTGKPKLAGWLLDNDQGRTSGKILQVGCAAAGCDYVGPVYYSNNLTDAVSQVTQLKQWGANYLASPTGGEATDLVINRDMLRQNYRALYMGSGTTATAAVNSKDPSLVGAYAIDAQAGWGDTNIPEVALIRNLYEQYHPGRKAPVNFYLAGWMSGLIVAEAFGRTIDKYGVDKLTGDNIRESMETFRNVSMNGLGDNITYTPGDHRGAKGVRFLRVNDKFEVLPVTGFMAPPALTADQMTVEFWQ